MRTPFQAMVAAAVLLAVIFGFAGSSFAQSCETSIPVRSQHGAWAVACDQPPGAPEEQCALSQVIAPEDRPGICLAVFALKTADQKARILRVVAPLGVLLPRGVGLYVDGKPTNQMVFYRCLDNGCYAETLLDDTLLDTLSTGKSAALTIYQTPEKESVLALPLDLKGFGEGFKSLP